MIYFSYSHINIGKVFNLLCHVIESSFQSLQIKFLHMDAHLLLLIVIQTVFGKSKLVLLITLICIRFAFCFGCDESASEIRSDLYLSMS